MQELLKIDKSFRPCPADDGDEINKQLKKWQEAWSTRKK